MNHIKINLNSDHPLPPRWALKVATKLLPHSVKLWVILHFLGSSGAIAEKGMDATLADVLADARGHKDKMTWEKPSTQTWERENEMRDYCIKDAQLTEETMGRTADVICSACGGMTPQQYKFLEDTAPPMYAGNVEMILSAQGLKRCSCEGTEHKKGDF